MDVAAPKVGWFAAIRETVADRPRMSWRGELLTGILGTWMLIGLHTDGWAHRNVDLLDTIWTPWHAIFYSGGLSLMGWIVWNVVRNVRAGRRGLSAVPEGYALGLGGVILFMIGGVGDQIWHTLLGIEVDLAAFISPTHMLLAIGIFFMVSSSLRAAWSSDMSTKPGFMEFLPALISLTLAVDFLGFLYNYLLMFPSTLPFIDDAAFQASFPEEVSRSTLYVFSEQFRMLGIVSIHFTTLLLLTPVLLAMRRWKLPFGSVTAMFLFVSVAVASVYQLEQGWTIVAAGLAGLVGDVIISRWDPSPRNIVPLRVFAAVVPMMLWGAYFAVLGIFYEIGWDAPFWAGSMILPPIFGIWLSLLTAPQPVPAARAPDRLPVAEQA